MPVYHVVGDALVSDAELIEKKTLGTLDKFNAKETATLEYSTGLTTLDNMATTVPVLETAGEFADFVPIGLGKPLIIEIRNVYTGRETKKKKDLLVTSAIKNIASFNASPRAINFLKKDVSPHSNVTTPAATEQGTPLLFYSPALVQESSVFTVEFGFDEFPNEAFETVGGTFQKASGIPIFAVANPT
jgi:hypothetical protein